MANVAGKLPARLAAICKRSRRIGAAKRRDPGIVAEKAPRIGKRIWTDGEEGFERAAFAGFGFNCVWHGNAPYAGVDLAASAGAFAAVRPPTVERNCAGFAFAGANKNGF